MWGRVRRIGREDPEDMGIRRARVPGVRKGAIEVRVVGRAKGRARGLCV